MHPAPWYIGLRQPVVLRRRRRRHQRRRRRRRSEGQCGRRRRRDACRSMRIQWNSVRRAEGSGFYTWDTERIEVPAGEWTVDDGGHAGDAEDSGAGGRVLSSCARRPATPTAAGRGRTRGSTRSAAATRRGSDTITTGSSSSRSARRGSPARRARIMIQSPWESATALLTVEREGIRRAERFALTSTQQTVEVPITEAGHPERLRVGAAHSRPHVERSRARTAAIPASRRSGSATRSSPSRTRPSSSRSKVTADREEYRPANTREDLRSR